MIITGTYQYKIFFNTKDAQAGFMLKPREGTCEEYVTENGLVRVTGKFCLEQKHMPLFITGEWKQSEYGKEFIIEDICETVISLEDTENFIRELGITTSNRIIKKILKITGADIFAAINIPNIEAEICETAGVDSLIVVKLFSKLRSIKRELSIFKLIDKHNGTYEHASKIIKKHPEDAAQLLNKDAYQILRDTDIPFKIIDSIARDQGVDLLSDSRIKAILSVCIKRQKASGNVYMTFDDLCKAVARNFGEIPKTAILAALDDHYGIVRDKEFPDLCYEKSVLEDEKNAAHDIMRLLTTRKKLPYHPEYIDQIEKENGYPFGVQQREAFLLLQTTGIKLFTGDPGTGKTTTANALITYLKYLWEDVYGKTPEIALCAPSGRAAQRMKETTHMVAKTIHKLIEFQPYGDTVFYKNSLDPIEADIIVVDEVSMMGLSLFSKLLSAIKSGSLLLMIGDANQLPSVEAGNVLQDIINCGYIDRCHLTEIFRQGEDSLININARKVLSGDQNLECGTDFSVIKAEPGTTTEILKSKVYDLIQEVEDGAQVQVLSPVKKGSCGVRDGNLLLQGILNPNGKGGIWYGYRQYREGDRVIMVSNNYGMNYFNGDIGYVKHTGNSSISVEIGEETITMNRDLFGDMDLANIITVHKSQGSEYPHLVIVLQEESKSILDMNILYTAITRGKKSVTIIYEQDTLEKAIRTRKNNTRNSLLVHRIRKEARKYGW